MLNQYLYQIIVVENKELKEVINKMIKEEINHLNIIGKIIQNYLKYPIFATSLCGKEKYWNTYDLYYDKEDKIILEIDLEQKKRAIMNYQMFLKYIDDINIQNKLKSILTKEFHHLEELNRIYQNEN